MCHARSFYLRDCWRIFAAKSMPRFSSAQMVAIGRPRIRLAARKAFTPGEQQRTYTVLETLFWMTRNQLRNIEGSLHRSAQRCLFGHSARNKRSEERRVGKE